MTWQSGQPHPTSMSMAPYHNVEDFTLTSADHERVGSVLFCHDFKFYIDDDGNVYLPDENVRNVIWERYLDAFERVVIAARGLSITEHDNAKALTRISAADVEFLSMPSLSQIKALLQRRKAAAILATAIDRVDAVVVRVPSELGHLAAGVARKAGKPVAMEVIGNAWGSLWHYGNLAGKVYAPILHRRARNVIEKADYVIYVTQHHLQEVYPTSGYAVAVTDADLPPADATVLQRRQLRIRNPTSPMVIGLIGNYHYKLKGVHIAISALARVKDDLPPFEFRILGQGDPKPLQAEAERLGLQDRVRFSDPLAGGEKVLAWLDEIDLYLQASFSEGLSRALLEAMSRGCPALGSTAGGTSELLPPECLHKPGDVEILARQLLNTKSQEWLLQQAARNFERSKDYDSSMLNDRRQAFWQSFARFAAKAA